MMANHTFARAAICMALGFGLLLGACARDEEEQSAVYEPAVAAEANPNVNLTLYSTFDIVNPVPSAMGEPPRQFLDAQTELEDAIVAELGGKGLTRDRTSPQLLVNPLIGQQPTSTAAQFYDAAYGWYWGYEHLWTSDAQHVEGTIVLDVVDRRDVDDVDDDVLVYRGSAQGLMAQDGEVIERELRSSVKQIFAQWPMSARPAT
jgi:hypothetical protein